MDVDDLPVLYSLQHCPYAMRARFAILMAQQKVQIRPIVMKEKPTEMILSSPKATVPVLVIKDDQVIDESLDIMLWALNLSDPENLLYSHDEKALPEMLKVITENDDEFKPSLEKYKRAKRFHGDDLEECRSECEPFVQMLEQRLSKHRYFMGSTPSLLDIALLSFIRQFSKVNKTEFADDRYKNLSRWLRNHIQSRLFARAMFKYPLWLENREVIIFGEK